MALKLLFCNSLCFLTDFIALCALREICENSGGVVRQNSRRSAKKTHLVNNFGGLEIITGLSRLVPQ